MADRKQISKKIRFEVFKRDGFKCQYCGASAPDIILHVDHIKPVSKGGKNTITNLITACSGCNLGKSDIELTDNSVLKKQKAQLEELQTRKEQLEFMMKWEQELLNLDAEKLESLSTYWKTLTRTFVLNEHGKESLRRLIAKYPLDEITKAMRNASQQYFKLDENSGEYSQESLEYGWKKIPGILKINLSGGYNEDFAKMHYIKGILRNRLNYCKENEALSLMKKAKELNVSLDSVQRFAKECRNWTEWKNGMEAYIENHDTDTEE